STNLMNDFPEVQDLVLVGIAGAVPHPEKVELHVRLGDVVVLGDHGVVQFDMVKISPTETEYRHPPRPPSARLLRAAIELIWHEYAAFVAAVYLRCILFLVPGTTKKEVFVERSVGSFAPGEVDSGQDAIVRSSPPVQSTSTASLLVEASTLPVSLAEVAEAAN